MLTIRVFKGIRGSEQMDDKRSIFEYPVQKTIGGLHTAFRKENIFSNKASQISYFMVFSSSLLCLDSDKEELSRLRKVFVGVVFNSSKSYNIQSYFEIEGYFSIKVTPLGANLCLMEEVEKGAIRDLVKEGRSWWSQWFADIREWREENVD